MRATIQGVELPFDLESWIVPDWSTVLEHYTRFARAVRERGATPWSIQPYMMEFAKQLVKLVGYQENGHVMNEDEVVTRYFQHYGMGHWEKMVAAAKDGRDLAAESEAFRAQIEAWLAAKATK